MTVIFVTKDNFNFKTTHFNAEMRTYVYTECYIKRQKELKTEKNETSFAFMQMAALS